MGTALAIKTETPQPFRTDEALAESLEQHCGLRLVAKGIERPGEPKMAIIPTGSKKLDVAQAAKMLRAAWAPLPSDEIEASLATLSTLTARRSQSESEEELALSAYVSRLREYPADIVKQVLARWPSSSRWWPTWYDLEQKLEMWASWRRRALVALEYAAENEAA